MDDEQRRRREKDLIDAAWLLGFLAGTVGKRLTYRVLTGQADAGFMGLA